MKLKWRAVRLHQIYVNSANNLHLRRLFALKLVEILKAGKRVLNFYESVLHTTIGNRFSWCPRGKVNLRVLGKEIIGLSVLLTASSEGMVYLQYLDGTNTEASVATYLMCLVEELD